jgi:hypothetical protein
MLVKINKNYQGDIHDMVGVVVESNVNMWGEDVVPSGVAVQWSDGTIETIYSDELMEVAEADPDAIWRIWGDQ